MRELIQLTASAAREVVHLYFDPLRWMKGRLQGRGGDDDVEVTARRLTHAELVEHLSETRTLDTEEVHVLLREEHLVEDKSPGSSVRQAV